MSEPWLTIRRRVLRNAPLCYVCEENNKIVAALECDHVIPVPIWEGVMGENFYDTVNLRGICTSCHIEKTRKERQIDMEAYRNSEKGEFLYDDDGNPIPENIENYGKNWNEKLAWHRRNFSAIMKADATIRLKSRAV